MEAGNSGSGSLKLAWTVKDRAKLLVESARLWVAPG